MDTAKEAEDDDLFDGDELDELAKEIEAAKYFDENVLFGNPTSLKKYREEKAKE